MVKTQKLFRGHGTNVESLFFSMVVGALHVDDADAVMRRNSRDHDLGEQAGLLQQGSPRKTTKQALGESWSIWLSFFLLGTINNVPFVVVNSAAKSIVDTFHVSKYIGAIQWANVAFGGVARAVNMAMVRVGFPTRALLNAVVMFIGLIGLALSMKLSFATAVLSIVLVGFTSSFGESLLLCYLKSFSGSLTGAFSSGTGMAGVAGSMFYILMYSILNYSNEFIFSLLIPLTFVYFICFRYTEPIVCKSGPGVSSMPVLDSGETPHLLRPPEPFFHSVQRSLRVVYIDAIQLCLVYFFEYCISILFASCADRARDQSESWARRNSYELLAVCYQVGVLLSRSSIGILRIRRVSIITSLQFVNFVFWFLHAFVNFIPLWAQLLWMLWVGLLGGAMYVNVFYTLTEPLHNPIPAEEREMAINVTTIFITIGIISSSLFEISLCSSILDCSS